MIDLGLLELPGVAYATVNTAIKASGAKRGASIDELRAYAADHPNEVGPGTYLAPETTRRRQGHFCMAMLTIVDLGHCVRQYESSPPVEGDVIKTGISVAVVY